MHLDPASFALCEEHYTYLGTAAQADELKKRYFAERDKLRKCRLQDKSSVHSKPRR